MSAEAVRSVVINKETVPEELSGLDRAEIRPGEGLVLISGENEKKVRHVGEFAVDLLVKAGFAEEIAPVEISPEAQAIIDRLETRNTLLQAKVDSLEQEKAELTANYEERFAKMQSQIDELRNLLENGTLPRDEEPEPLDEQPADRIEYSPGEEVALQRPDQGGKFQPGFEVVKSDESIDEDQFLVKGKDGGRVFPVPKSRVRKLSEVPEDEWLAPPAGLPEDTGVVRRRYVPRETLWRRFRNATPLAVEEREYFVDENGPYYLENGEPVYVTREEAEGRSIGAAALVAAGIVGIAAWELIGERIFGFSEGSSDSLKTVVHNQAIEINKLNRLNEHLSSVDSNLNSHLTQLNKHLSHEIAGLKAEEIGARGKDIRDSGAYWSFRYPWDWAVHQVGAYRAENWLHQLAARAARHGHAVRWIYNGREPNGSIREILQVDGTTNTQKVLETITQYH